MKEGVAEAKEKEKPHDLLRQAIGADAQHVRRGNGDLSDCEQDDRGENIPAADLGRRSRATQKPSSSSRKAQSRDRREGRSA